MTNDISQYLNITYIKTYIAKKISFLYIMCTFNISNIFFVRLTTSLTLIIYIKKKLQLPHFFNDFEEVNFNLEKKHKKVLIFFFFELRIFEFLSCYIYS